jgi:uncharacterized membrane protein YhaH (DUF805 family)
MGAIMHWYIEVLRKYAVFGGRARRKEYWFFVLFNILISIGLGIIDGITGTYNVEVGIGLLGSIYALAVLIPSIAVTVRRLHDVDRSGWWILIAFIPIIGAIVLLVFMVLDSNSGPNRFGENPKTAGTLTAT